MAPFAKSAVVRGSDSRGDLVLLRGMRVCLWFNALEGCCGELMCSCYDGCAAFVMENALANVNSSWILTIARLDRDFGIKYIVWTV